MKYFKNKFIIDSCCLCKYKQYLFEIFIKEEGTKGLWSYVVSIHWQASRVLVPIFGSYLSIYFIFTESSVLNQQWEVIEILLFSSQLSTLLDSSVYRFIFGYRSLLVYSFIRAASKG